MTAAALFIVPMEPRQRPDDLDPLRSLVEAPDAEAERRAWTAFLAAYTPVLLGVAASLGGEYDARMDRYAFIIERLRCDGYARLRQYSPRDGIAFAAWLRVVARRLCLDLYRHQRGRVRPVRGDRRYHRLMRARLHALHGVSLELAEQVPSKDADPGAGIDSREAVTRLRRACARLSPADQELLRLRFEHDLPAVAVARRIGAPSPFHVYRRLRHVLGTLRGEIERPGTTRLPRPAASSNALSVM